MRGSQSSRALHTELLLSHLVTPLTGGSFSAGRSHNLLCMLGNASREQLFRIPACILRHLELAWQDSMGITMIKLDNVLNMESLSLEPLTAVELLSREVWFSNRYRRQLILKYYLVLLFLCLHLPIHLFYSNKTTFCFPFCWAESEFLIALLRFVVYGFDTETLRQCTRTCLCIIYLQQCVSLD